MSDNVIFTIVEEGASSSSYTIILPDANANNELMSASDDITRYENATLEDDDDLDVIDCYTEDFESDMEKEDCQNKTNNSEQKGTTLLERRGDTSTLNEISIETIQTTEKKVSSGNDSTTLSTNGHDITCSFIDDSNITSRNKPAGDANTGKKQIVCAPKITVQVQGEAEKQRLLNEPLKQVVIPALIMSDVEGNETDDVRSVESLDLQIDYYADRVSEILETQPLAKVALEKTSQKASTEKASSNLFSNCDHTDKDDAPDNGLDDCQPEDPDVLQIRLNLYQDYGEMDYEAEEDDQKGAGRDNQTDNNDGEFHLPVRIKEEPSTPLKSRIQSLNIKPEDIPTIELSSEDDDDILEYTKRNGNTSRVQSNRKRLDSDESMDEAALMSLYNDRVMSLRKRRVTIYPELILPKRTHRAASKKLSDDECAKETCKKKKKIDPAMVGYKKRKTVHRSSSKTSVSSASTSNASSVLDEHVTGDTANNESVGAPRTNHDGNLETIEEQPSNEASDGTPLSQLNEVTVNQADKNATENEVAQKSADVYLDIPESTTDVALEAMLESYLNHDVNTEKAIPFHSISPDEKLLMDSLFAACETEQSEQNASPSNALNDAAPNEATDPLGNDALTFSYDISNNLISSVDIVSTAEESSQTKLNSEDTLSTIKPRINVIKGYDKDQFQLQKKHAGRPIKEIEPLAQTKSGRKKEESDEEYLPSGHKTTKKSRKRTSKSLNLSRTTSKSTGKYISQDSELLKPCITETGSNDAKESVMQFSSKKSNSISMPSLEEDLALTSSDSDATPKAPKTDRTNKIVMPNLEGKRGNKTSGVDGSKGITRKRGRPRTKICDFFSEKSTHKSDSVTSQKLAPNTELITQSQESTIKSMVKPTTKNRQQDTCAEDVSCKDINNADTDSCTSLVSLAASNTLSDDESFLDSVPKVGITEKSDNVPELKMDTLQVIISPLNDEKIRKINLQNSKRRQFVTKASQTEIWGLTWSIDNNPIDFHSPHFEKLRMQLNSGAAKRSIQRMKPTATSVTLKQLSDGDKNIPLGSLEAFSGLEMPSRAALQLQINTPPLVDANIAQRPAPKTAPVASVASNIRTPSETLLFKRSSEDGETISRNMGGQPAREIMGNSTNSLSSFRIPRIAKQLSSSPDAVTSSTTNVDILGKDIYNDSPSASSSRSSCRTEASIRSGTAPLFAANQKRSQLGEYSRDEYSSSNDPKSLRNQNQPCLASERFEMSAASSNSKDLSKATYAKDSNQSYAAIRSAISNRADLVGQLTRTITNDYSQPSAQPMQPQTILPMQQPGYNPIIHPAFQPFGSAMGPTSNNVYNQMYANYPQFDVKPFAHPSTLSTGMFAAPAINNPTQSANPLNDVLSILCEHLKQQQPSQFNPPPAQQPTINYSVGNQQQTYNPLLLGIPSAATQSDQFRSLEAVDIINYVFGCYDNLNGKCIKLHCKHNHLLPKEDTVHQKLSSQSRDFIMTTYKFMASRDELFIRYFPVYTAVMGRNQMRHQLAETIQDCEQPKRSVQYYRYIVEGLKLSGMNPTQAVQIIIDKHTKKNFNQINVIVDLIIETGDGVASFLWKLQEFSNVANYSYETTAINKLLNYCIVSGQPSDNMVQFVSKLVLKVPVDEESLINGILLLEFIRKLVLSQETVLSITAKYGKLTRV